MAAIVRVKRRREDDVADSLVLLCKKAKSVSPNAAISECTVEEVKSVFKFAGTVTAKVSLRGVKSIRTVEHLFQLFHLIRTKRRRASLR